MSLLESEFYHQIQSVNDVIPAIETWDPPFSGDMECLIKRDGSWWIENSKISNDKLIRLFSTVLKYEDDDYFLVTPVEKWRIRVEDLPFLVVELNIAHLGTGEQTIEARTNVGDRVTIDNDHRIATSPIRGLTGDQSIPFVHIRSNLMARFNRNTYLEIANLMRSQSNSNHYSLLSADTIFTLGF